MDFFSFFTRNKPSKNIAKDRLKLVLIHDRGDFSKEKLEAIKKDLIETLNKYVDIEEDGVEISVVNKKDQDTKSVLAHLNLDMPIRKIK